MAAAASGSWGRIIRPPRRRGKHVILDVCPAAAASDGAQQPGSTSTAADGSVSSGRLERHVVAKSDARKAMGPAGYRIAQKAGWGDLWPAPYMAETRKEVLGPREERGAGRDEGK